VSERRDAENRGKKSKRGKGSWKEIVKGHNHIIFRRGKSEEILHGSTEIPRKKSEKTK